MKQFNSFYDALSINEPKLIQQIETFATFEIINQNTFVLEPEKYIKCFEDRAIPIAVQRVMYQGNVIKSYSLYRSHTPNFSQPKKVSSILLEIRNKIRN